MGIPACLWRRTGEIYKGNKEFAELVGVAPERLREGRLAIYELMAEESAVNYWEKVCLRGGAARGLKSAQYGSIAFNSGQKAVLTSCVLINVRSLCSGIRHPDPGSKASHHQRQSQAAAEGRRERDSKTGGSAHSLYLFVYGSTGLDQQSVSLFRTLTH
jgi:hypothetical protein